ncbi:CatB-related O-acetyltransferase [Kaistella carnis]|uniref:CatB-related O-acetyltransferase n=1 Tax=Kaistella carnis TaxID=1241979 RepID=UPI0028A65A6F|nr:DapH/DapD/GlmU-related protein [Kaistella carnis]
MDTIIKDSEISDDTVKLYQCVQIVSSKISNNSVVGDFSRVTNSVMFGFNRIDRNSLIYNSKLGYCSYIGSNSKVLHSEIGKYCSIAWNVTIGPANHDYKKFTSHDFLYNTFYDILEKDEDPIYNRFEKKTIIGNDVWIGANSTILNGITVGDGAVIGANTIVTKNVPPYGIVVGNPGILIKFRFSSDIISQLLKLKWWDLSKEVLKENFNIFKSNDIQKIINVLKERI